MKGQLVIITGVVEAALGSAAAFSRTRKVASRCIMAFLLCVIPINLYHLLFGGASLGLPATLLWARVLFIGALSYWALFNSNLGSATSTRALVKASS